MTIAPATVLSPRAIAAPSSLPRALGQVAFVAGVAVAIGLALVVLGLKLAGWQTLTVLTGSMRPTIVPGQAVVVSPLRASAIVPGQIVTFRRPHGPGTMTHRVQRVTPLADGRLSVTTRGDANRGSETWQIRPDGRVGRLRTVLPPVGGAIGFVVAGRGRPYLLAAAVLVGTALALLWIWTPERGRRPVSGRGSAADGAPGALP